MPGASKELPRDFDKIFDKRLKSFRFTAIPPKLEEWKGTSVVSNVFDVEMNVRNFKSTEERMIYRMEVWIDMCRIETYLNGTLTNGTGKFHSAKRFRKPTESKLMKVRSFSMGKATSRSMESLDKPLMDPSLIRRNSGEFVTAVEIAANARMAPAKSTGNLLDTHRKTTERHIYVDQDDPDRDIEQTLDKYGTNPKRKLKFFLFRKKSDKGEKSNDSNINERKRTGSSAIKKNNKGSRKTKTKQQEKEEEEYKEPENNNLGKSSQPKIRPSVFDMESLRGSIPDKKTYGYEYDPFKRNQNGIRENQRYNTVGTPRTVLRQGNTQQQQTQQQKQNNQLPTYQQQQQHKDPTLFNARHHNDSVKRQKIKSKYTPDSAAFNGPVFFDPKKKITREPSVRTELGQI